VGQRICLDNSALKEELDSATPTQAAILSLVMLLPVKEMNVHLMV
jgi:hypothetical protein